MNKWLPIALWNIAPCGQPSAMDMDKARVGQ